MTILRRKSKLKKFDTRPSFTRSMKRLRVGTGSKIATLALTLKSRKWRLIKYLSQSSRRTLVKSSAKNSPKMQVWCNSS